MCVKWNDPTMFLISNLKDKGEVVDDLLMTPGQDLGTVGDQGLRLGLEHDNNFIPTAF